MRTVSKTVERIAALLGALLIILLRPLITIRLGIIDGSRIGALLLQPAEYLSIKNNSPQVPLRIDLHWCSEPVCNLQLQKIIERRLRLLPWPRFGQLLTKGILFWAHGQSYHHSIYPTTNWRYITRQPLQFELTKDEKLRGRQLASVFGIPPGEPWACIHNRDHAYLDSAVPTTNWDYHDYRNFPVSTMVDAAEELANRGYYVIRVGSTASLKISSSNPKIIDYANSHNVDNLLDIYLNSQCALFIGCDSGLWVVPYVFGRPIAMVNHTLWLNFERYFTQPKLFIPKTVWSNQTQKFLSLKEILNGEIKEAYTTQMFAHAEVTLINNSPQEIRDVTVELLERTSGQWIADEGDEELQRAFWIAISSFMVLPQYDNERPRIGAAFLRKHKYLLD